MSEQTQNNVTRRNFLKAAGLAGASAQVGGLIGAGIQAGKDPESYTGWESFHPGTQFIDREPLEFESPAHPPVGDVRRPSHITDYVFGRVAAFEAAIRKHPGWKINDPIEVLEFPPALTRFYKDFPERLEWDYRTFTETIPRYFSDMKKYRNVYLLAHAYEAGFTAHGSALPRPTAPPEVWDFAELGSITKENPQGRHIKQPVPFKSPGLAAHFVKEIAHRYGATLVRITRTNPYWLYDEGWRGCPPEYDFSRMPPHWEYAIVFGVPMEWDVVLANPQLGTSFDAYDRVSATGIRLEGMLKYLGYPARAHTPMTDYDLIVPPHAVEAGMGEAGRTGFCITPELGGNCRMAIVTTSLPMEIDRPIKFGLAEFCNKCKICAEQCPSGAISNADSPAGLVIRGYEHWYINNGACYNFWRESMGPLGCRLCVANCPFSRKDNWLHNLARSADRNDPTGITSNMLIWMQNNFFDNPTAEEYRRPPTGRFASYRPEPAYLHSESYLNIDVVYPE